MAVRYKEIKLQLNRFEHQWRNFMRRADLEDLQEKKLRQYKLLLKKKENQLLKNCFQELNKTGWVSEETIRKYSLLERELKEIKELWQKQNDWTCHLNHQQGIRRNQFRRMKEKAILNHRHRPNLTKKRKSIYLRT